MRKNFIVILAIAICLAMLMTACPSRLGPDIDTLRHNTEDDDQMQEENNTDGNGMPIPIEMVHIPGGSWSISAQYARSAYRGYDSPYYYYGYLGFRLARP